MELLSLAGVALTAVAALFSTGRVRQIVRAIFSRPTKRSIVLTIDGDTLVIDNPTPEQERRLFEEFVRRHVDSEASAIGNTSAGDVESGSGGDRRE